jgi:hypothetical protein
MSQFDTEVVTKPDNQILFALKDISRLQWGATRARAFKRLRESRNISVRRLATMLTERGHDATHGLIAKIEDNIATSVDPDTIVAAIEILEGNLSDYYSIFARLDLDKSSVIVSLTFKD